YFVNRETLELFTHYPLLLGCGLAALVLVPLLLAVSYLGERPTLLAAHARPRRIAARLLGLASATAVLLACLNASGPFAKAFNKPMWVAINDRSFITDFVTSFND